MATVKITVGELKKMVAEEKRKLAAVNEANVIDAECPGDVPAEETDADEYGDALEHKVDWLKKLDIKEQKLARELKAVQARKRAIKSR